ncbi:MAG: PAS domain-containing hybrid sensor histidine kinase/response regulator [Syntrophobacteraceae bacterium]
MELLSDLAGDVARTLQALEDQRELVAAHSALRDSEVKMRSIFRAAPTGIGLSSNRIMLEVNERLCEMVGYRREELIGKSTRMLYPSDEDYEYVGGEKYRQMREKGRWTVETRFLRKEGEIIDILMSSSSLDPTDLASGVTFTALDITRQKQDQAELLKLFRHNKLILDTAQEGIVGLDPAGKVTFSNPAAAATLGYSIEELLGKDLHKLVHHTKPGGEPYPESECPMIRALRTGQVFSVRDEVLYRKGGSWFHSAYSTSPIEEKGAITGAVVTLRDITARRQAEENLRESEKRHRALFENMVSGFVLFEVVQDDRGVPVDLIILTANKGFEASTGLKVSDVVGKRFTHVLPGIEKDEADWIGVYGKVARTGESQQFEKGSERLGVFLSVTAYRAGPGQCCVTFQDITERKRSEEERARVEAQLRQAQKMEALGTLAGGVAHDFNNILNIIMGYTELSKMEVEEGSAVAQNLEEVFAASTRAKELVQQILAFSRRSENRKLCLQPGIIVKEAMKMLRPSLPSTIEIKTELLGRSPVLADPTQLHQVLMNLCTNAGHAMRDKGGVLEVMLDDRVLGDDEARHYDGLQPGAYVELRVRDTGGGIEPGIIDSIFDPFFTTKKQGEGTGLGLSVVHGIVKSHGGTINVQSTLGEGAAFTVLIPALPGNHLHEEKATADHLPGGRERILVVDDEPALVKMTGRLLSKLGYDVVTRTGGLEALDVLKHQHDAKPFDLVITDMTMPHLTGEDLVRELSKCGIAVPVILMTGFSEKIDVEKAKNLGIEGFLMKPIVSKDIAETIRKVLDRG